MKRNLIVLLGFAFVLVAVLSTGAGPLLAHHGRGATYDMKNQKSIKGTITEILWRNPHIGILVDVTDANGKVVNWTIEHSNITTLAKLGYNRNTLKVGQEVTIVISPGSDGSPIGLCSKVILPDGKEVFVGRNGSID